MIWTQTYISDSKIDAIATLDSTKPTESLIFSDFIKHRAWEVSKNKKLFVSFERWLNNSGVINKNKIKNQSLEFGECMLFSF